MNRKYVLLAGISALIVALDQLTKIYVHTHFFLGESLPVISGFFNLTYVRNPGAAFGFLAQAHPNFREAFFLIMPPIALAIILMILRTVRSNDTLQILSLTSVFGGAIGNYIDRIRFHYVIDFLDFHFKDRYTWPAFNVADMAIVCGVGGLLVIMFLESRQAKKAATP